MCERGFELSRFDSPLGARSCEEEPLFVSSGRDLVSSRGATCRLARMRLSLSIAMAKDASCYSRSSDDKSSRPRSGKTRSVRLGLLCRAQSKLSRYPTVRSRSSRLLLRVEGGQCKVSKSERLKGKGAPGDARDFRRAECAKEERTTGDSSGDWRLSG